jgi:hypothetical protein
MVASATYQIILIQGLFDFHQHRPHRYPVFV